MIKFDFERDTVASSECRHRTTTSKLGLVSSIQRGVRSSAFAEATASPKPWRRLVRPTAEQVNPPYSAPSQSRLLQLKRVTEHVDGRIRARLRHLRASPPHATAVDRDDDRAAPGRSPGCHRPDDCRHREPCIIASLSGVRPVSMGSPRCAADVDRLGADLRESVRTATAASRSSCLEHCSSSWRRRCAARRATHLHADRRHGTAHLFRGLQDRRAW